MSNYKSKAGSIYTFEIPSMASEQDLNVSADDIAGNHLESGVEGFLITTNFLILWFENTPLFIGTIAIVTAIAGTFVYLIIRRKRKLA